MPTDTPLASFLETMPPWYAKSAPNKPPSYPLGAYDPDPEKTWLSALNAHRVMHPDMGDSDFTTSRTRSHGADHGDIFPNLKRIHARRLRELYRSAGWPYQGVIEIELLAAGLLERIPEDKGVDCMRVTDASIHHCQ